MTALEYAASETGLRLRRQFENTLSSQESDGFDIIFAATWIETPIGPMLAAADDSHLFLLSFVENADMDRRVDTLRNGLKAGLHMGDNDILRQVRDEIAGYFEGTQREFTIPMRLHGTSFQLAVWDEIIKVPYGNTTNYNHIAEAIGKPSSFRAVAQANAQNPIHLLVPCHRVINADGRLGGHSAGVERKQWLIDFEQRNLSEDD